MKKKVLIVGGVAGGASAAARLRRLDENAEIIMFERDAHISFANCGLPYYVGETIQDRSKLMVQTPESMKARFNLDVRIHSEVTGIDTNEKTVTVYSKEKGIYKESYDYLILSPGAKPLKPPIPGIESNLIYTLRTIPDTDRIKAHVDREGIQSAIVIGGGYIGVEMAENLRQVRKCDRLLFVPVCLPVLLKGLPLVVRIQSPRFQPHPLQRIRRRSWFASIRLPGYGL